MPESITTIYEVIFLSFLKISRQQKNLFNHSPLLEKNMHGNSFFTSFHWHLKSASETCSTLEKIVLQVLSRLDIEIKGIDQFLNKHGFLFLCALWKHDFEISCERLFHLLVAIQKHDHPKGVKETELFHLNQIHNYVLI